MKDMDYAMAVEAENNKVLFDVVGGIEVDVVHVNDFVTEVGLAGDTGHAIAVPRRERSFTIRLAKMTFASFESWRSLMTSSPTGALGRPLRPVFLGIFDAMLKAKRLGERVIHPLLAVQAKAKRATFFTSPRLAISNPLQAVAAILFPGGRLVLTTDALASKSSEDSVDGLIMKTKSPRGFATGAGFFVGLFDQIDVGWGSSRHGRLLSAIYVN